MSSTHSLDTSSDGCVTPACHASLAAMRSQALSYSSLAIWGTLKCFTADA